jgi:hypothetical protein
MPGLPIGKFAAAEGVGVETVRFYQRKGLLALFDENPRTALRYEVLLVPTMNVYSGGEVVRQIIGAKPKSALLRELSGVVGAPA